MNLLKRSPTAPQDSETPTLLTITPGMVSRAAQAIMACDAQDHLRDCYGLTSSRRAEWFAEQALKSALDLRLEDPS